MTRSLYTAFTYLVLGLASGLFSREYTKHTDNLLSHTPLNVMHTHLLTLGMIVFLVVLALDALLGLSGRRSFTVFYWTYNVGLVVTVALQGVRGLLTLGGHDPATTSAAIPGIAGLGHILLTVGLVSLFVALRAAVRERTALAGADASRQAGSIPAA